MAHSGMFGNIHNYPAGEGIYQETYLQQPLKRDTLAFTIPVDENNNPVDRGFENFYKVSTAERTWTTLNPISERSEFYGLDRNNYPSFGVRYPRQRNLPSPGSPRTALLKPRFPMMKFLPLRGICRTHRIRICTPSAHGHLFPRLLPWMPPIRQNTSKLPWYCAVTV